MRKIVIEVPDDVSHISVAIDNNCGVLTGMGYLHTDGNPSYYFDDNVGKWKVRHND